MYQLTDMNWKSGVDNFTNRSEKWGGRDDPFRVPHPTDTLRVPIMHQTSQFSTPYNQGDLYCTTLDNRTNVRRQNNMQQSVHPAGGIPTAVETLRQPFYSTGVPVKDIQVAQNVAAEFPKAQAVTMLRNVEPTIESVTSCAVLLRAWKDKSSLICNVMTDCYCEKHATPRNRLGIFYVYNDLVQRNPNLFAESGMRSLIKPVAALIDESLRHSYLRTVSVWQERNVFPKEVCEKIHEMFTASVKTQSKDTTTTEHTGNVSSDYTDDSSSGQLPLLNETLQQTAVTLQLQSLVNEKVLDVAQQYRMAQKSVNLLLSSTAIGVEFMSNSDSENTKLLEEAYRQLDKEAKNDFQLCLTKARDAVCEEMVQLGNLALNFISLVEENNSRLSQLSALFKNTKDTLNQA